MKIVPTIMVVTNDGDDSTESEYNEQACSTRGPLVRIFQSLPLENKTYYSKVLYLTCA